MNKISNMLLCALIPGAIMAVIAVFTDVIPFSLPLKIACVFLIYIIAVGIIAITNLFWNGWIKARFDLWHIGKVRGLWAKKGLIKQNKKNFYSADDIKIKVTRGYELLEANNKYGLSEILSNLRDGKNKYNSKVSVKVLLIIPCFQEQHVRERYQRNNKITKVKFLETWYKFLEEIGEYNSANLSINVRFYFGNHSRWRFYIFSKPNGLNTTVLLSDYDENSSGCEQPMYKIIKGEHNLGSFMNDYFDELWNSALTSKNLYEFMKAEKCITHFCENCMKVENYNCKVCNRLNCNYKDMCNDLIEKYQEILGESI